jgi:hypothetical protein
MVKRIAYIKGSAIKCKSIFLFTSGMCYFIRVEVAQENV